MVSMSRCADTDGHRRRKYQLILMSNNNFDTQMQYRLAILDRRIKDTLNNTMKFVECDWEAEYQRDMAIRRQRGENLVKSKNK